MTQAAQIEHRNHMVPQDNRFGVRRDFNVCHLQNCYLTKSSRITADANVEQSEVQSRSDDHSDLSWSPEVRTGAVKFPVGLGEILRSRQDDSRSNFGAETRVPRRASETKLRNEKADDDDDDSGSLPAGHSHTAAAHRLLACRRCRTQRPSAAADESPC